MTILETLLLLLALFSLVYGIVKAIKNKTLSLLDKIVWIAIIVWLPFLGAMAYLRATFTTRD
ncbi:PLDc N-terminal domain-containing protein [Pedobacter gandavensis]|uniref:PLDc N-terminal domain-containing protein n=1 Tax=Pedobacter gandavensis TaxID=2679963 RepID=UPI00247980AD|nr:PLDc N-terminal domain-containing protein [Pedobacter gandavensis]WGQ10893.1 PLDc N-terminal domain-containing protein [Pedobacter gandavensis]